MLLKDEAAGSITHLHWGKIVKIYSFVSCKINGVIKEVHYQKNSKFLCRIQQNSDDGNNATVETNLFFNCRRTIPPAQ